jgi:hypothetical protein
MHGLVFTARSCACRGGGILRTAARFGALLLVVAAIGGAPAVRADALDVDETEPLHCWWRTSASAVRIAEVFTAVLTCAMVETSELAVNVDRSKIDPVAAQLPPFEVMSGAHAPDLVTADRRFFQFEYKLRLISDSFFNRDVRLPELPISYRLRTKLAGQEAAVEGAAQTYALPPVAVRMISLVPDTARDIRDATPGTFAGLDAARFHADTLVTTGMVLTAVAFALALVGFARIALERRGHGPAAARALSNASVLRAVGRELATIRRERESDGWTPALTGRALAASRVLGAYALGRPVTQRRGEVNGVTHEGAVPLRPQMLRRSRVLVYGAVTPEAVAKVLTKAEGEEHRVRRLQELHRTLATFTRVQYGAANGVGDGPLDEALDSGRRIGEELAFESGLLGRRLRGLGARVPRLRVWKWAR